MTASAFTRLERDELLARRRDALLRYEQCEEREWRDRGPAAAQREVEDEAERLFRVAESLERDYERRTPRVVMSCCPFCGVPLHRSFDPHGLDGLWWQPDSTPEEPRSCLHFCLMRGAVNFNGHAPAGGDFQAHTGPEVPYVIPAILDRPGVIAVLSQIEMNPGYIAYPIAYFAERRPPVQHLAADWPRTLFVYITGAGDRRWRVDRIERDFHLAPWIERGKLRWCPPRDCSTLTPPQPATECPYLGLSGERRCSVIVRSTRILQ